MLGYEVIVRIVVSVVALIAAYQAWAMSRALAVAETKRDASGAVRASGPISGSGSFMRFFFPLDVEIVTKGGREGALVTARFGNPELARLVGIGAVSVVETDCFSQGGVLAYRVGDAPPGSIAAEKASVSDEPPSPAVCLYPGTSIVPVTGAGIAVESDGKYTRPRCRALAY